MVTSFENRVVHWKPTNRILMRERSTEGTWRYRRQPVSSLEPSDPQADQGAYENEQISTEAEDHQDETSEATWEPFLSFALTTGGGQGTPE